MRHVTFQSLTSIDKRARGTSLQCYANFDYDDITSAFGEPVIPIVDHKTSAEWHIDVTQDGVPVGVVTLYDYKEHVGYREDGLETQDITEWHVGAKNKQLAADVIDFIQTSKKHEKSLQTTTA